jgi:cytochrome c-type biogenesis protein CcmH
MTTFWIIAAALMLVALSIVLIPLLRSKAEVGAGRAEINTIIYRQRLKELELEKDSGALDAGQFEQARLELQRSLLDDVSSVPGAETHTSRAGRWLAAAGVAVVVPTAAILLYSHFGRTDLLSSAASPEEIAAAGSHQSLAQVVNQLVAHQRANPDDVRGWVLLGRSYLALNRYGDSTRAYAKALAISKPNADLLVDYAEALALAQGDDLKGRPQHLIAQALKLDPKHEKGLWLSGIAQYQQSNYSEAVDYWQRLQSLLAPGSQPYVLVEQNITKAKSLLGQSKSEGASAAADGGVKLQVHVALASELAKQADPDTTVFIFARAVSGPPMPLAILRLRVRDLPTTVTLDDSMAMSPMAKLSRFPQVQVTARISRSGQATPRSGDLQGSVGPVKVGTDNAVDVTIDKVLP